jgi:precorrin-2 dehydrogenase/sirohydrochlorin ferrochelatase
MRYYPINIDVQDRHCLVVGGGQVGTRKVRTLVDCGAKVTVISPEVTQKLTDLAHRKVIRLKRRAYCDTDLDDVFLVIGATDDETLNRQIHEDAEKRQRLCNIADQPHLCNFILPSIINQGDLIIAISTSGNSPAFAKHLRRTLQDQFGPEYGQLLDLMGALRKRLLAESHAPEAHKPLFEKLIAAGLLELIRQNDQRAIDGLLGSVLGPAYRYRELIGHP